MKKNIYWTLFILYIAFIISVTLFNDTFGRLSFNLIFKEDDILSSLKDNINIIPFKTISKYIIGFIKNEVSFKNFAVNIIGNIVVFMPFGFFIPKLIENIELKKFLLTILLIILFIETTQLILMCGSFDIDDIILNILGATIIYKNRYLL